MAAADTTRMLVLGAAQIFEPVNGYQLRRELLSWNIESWANIQPGSIYSMLRTLTKQDLLVRTNITSAGSNRPVAVYTTTDAGRQELLRLLRGGLTDVEAFSQAGFYAALSLMIPLFSRTELLELLVVRQGNLRRETERARAHVRQLVDSKSAPPHVAKLLAYAGALPAAELHWLDGFVESIQAGEMMFAGEGLAEKWQPLPGDPAWRMADERAAYLAAMRTQPPEA